MLSLAAYAGTYPGRHYPGPLHRDISGTGDGANQCQQRHATDQFGNYIGHFGFLCRSVHFFFLRAALSEKFFSVISDGFYMSDNRWRLSQRCVKKPERFSGADTLAGYYPPVQELFFSELANHGSYRPGESRLSFPAVFPATVLFRVCPAICMLYHQPHDRPCPPPR
jgi:hypothetical protein